jgi:DNA polymerase-4
MRSPAAARSILHRLLQKAAMRLRSYGYVAGTMQVSVDFRDGGRWRRQAKFEPTSDSLRLLSALEKLWREFPQEAAQPFAVAVGLSRLEPQNRYRSLFDESHAQDKLNAIIDALNLRYGKNTLYFGGAHAALHAAPMRIAFGHIPDLAVEGDE